MTPSLRTAGGTAPPAPSPAPRVWLVGAGPGDPDLLTGQALKLLARARVLIHDALVSEAILALAPQALRLPVGKRAGQPSTPQSRINALLIAQAQALLADDPDGDSLVLRLKGGDPLLFARAQEEIDALEAAGIDFGVAPGITAAQAGFAAMRVPMTRRGERRALVLATPQVQQGDEADLSWARPLVASGGGALYMAAGCASRVRASLLVLGLPASLPAAWVVDASGPGQRLIPTRLGRIDQDAPRGPAPALLVLGAQAGQAGQAALASPRAGIIARCDDSPLPSATVSSPV